MGFRRCILSFKMVDWVVYVWWRDEVLLVCCCPAFLTSVFSKQKLQYHHVSQGKSSTSSLFSTGRILEDVGHHLCTFHHRITMIDEAHL